MRKFLYLIQILTLCVGLAAGWCAWEVRQSLEQPLRLTGEELIDVPKGATPGGTFNRLEEEGRLDNAFWLRLYWRFNLADQALHSGEYRVVPGQTVADLIDLWRRGDVVQYSLTLVEGWTFRQFRKALQAQEKLEHTLTDLSDDEIMARLGKPDEKPEGRFFPDTYRFVRGMRDIDLLKQANRRLDEVLDEEWAERDPDVPYADRYQALIMASLVEKETGVARERGEIAGVFVRRLAQGMLLQTDPTVIYGMGERYDGKIRRADLRDDTPYNTYVNAGLPPTPIAMVGRESLHAALHPVAGDSLYFVARGDGSHVFSATLAEHNQAVREYQLKRRADYRSSPPPSPSGADPDARPPEATPSTPDSTGSSAEPATRTSP